MTFTEFLDILSKIAPIISASVAIIAAIFIFRQIINIRRNREVDTLLKIIALSDSDNMRLSKDWLIYELDGNLTIPILKADKEALKKFSHVIHLFETMGVIVNNKYIPEKLIFDKYGLLIIGAWGKLQPVITAMRTNSQSYEYAENFEMLVDRYNKWAKKHPLKAVKGKKRMGLSEGKDFLDYSGRKNEQDLQKGTGSGQEG